ncbi:hypothetical protein JFL43_10725 [Viridibacillus sp. YIM B01967]|uniref:Uncharacterized protein n=1 Tax=Viridibacillus soli TaxID=2798301 RepID=A0ABS1H7D5_9BACL|nr:hypothetical protein [Viridibacillus soli]MBK3495316.1 hypothetical protein [Viridibacillus soli]
MDLKNLKNALSQSNVDEAAAILVNLFIQNPNTFKKSLLLSNSLPEPIAISFSNEKFDTLRRALLIGFAQLTGKGVDIDDILKYASDYIELTQVIKVINQNINSNLEMLEKNSFFEYSFLNSCKCFAFILRINIDYRKRW